MWDALICQVISDGNFGSHEARTLYMTIGQHIHVRDADRQNMSQRPSVSDGGRRVTKCGNRVFRGAKAALRQAKVLGDTHPMVEGLLL